MTGIFNKKIFITTLLIVLIFPLFGDSLVWQPINPAFGGNPYNGSWLLNSAQSQKVEKKNDYSSRYSPKDPLQQFEESLNRQILSKLAQKIVESLYNEDGEMIEQGEFEMGNYSINIYEDNGTMTVSLLDILTGAQTIVEIPN